jgi:hypothetical protein
MKNLFLVITTLFITVMLQSCMKEPVQTGYYNLSKSANEVTGIIYKQAESCWSKSFGFLSDGIKVKLLQNYDGNTITVTRFAPDINLPPFVMIKITRLDELKTNVSVSEGDASLDTFLKNTYSSDVDRWLKGNYICSEK